MRRREGIDPGLCQVTCIHPPDVARARSGLVADATYRDLADLFGALADPTRARIVHALLRQELCSCDIAAVAGVSASGASQHLRVLRNLRLVKARRAGKLVYYSLDDAHIALLVQVGLTHLGHEDPTSDLTGPTPALVGQGQA
jgi:ArsR family transcriptional regulator, lead/cadmium/zinc/bismuth-responsive transcriptional repressor